jgi:hypothetical protein
MDAVETAEQYEACFGIDQSTIEDRCKLCRII